MMQRSVKVGLAITVVAFALGVVFAVYIRKPAIAPLSGEEAIELARKCVAEEWRVKEEMLEVLSAELLPVEKGPFPENLREVLDKVWMVEFMLKEPAPVYFIRHLDNIGNVTSWVTQIKVWLNAYTGVRLDPVEFRFQCMIDSMRVKGEGRRIYRQMDENLQNIFFSNCSPFRQKFAICR
jgi:hypothetical protein